MITIDALGFVLMMLLAITTGLIGGMKLSRWCDRRDKLREKQAFLHLTNPRFLG
jgi:hypothetical protein